MLVFSRWLMGGVIAVVLIVPSRTHAETLEQQARATLQKAIEYFANEVATHGGYVYHYTPDLAIRWGEGLATKDQIWVQPPGTPTVGLAFLEAYKATGNKLALQAATDAALALVYGQLQSGGWTNCIDFDPRGSRTAQYRVGKGRGKNNSSLDDGQSQAATRLLMHVDQAHDFQDPKIHEAARIALTALLGAQFQSGAFPQVWTGPVSSPPPREANYPDYDWRTEGRIKEYWNMYTLNDDLASTVTETLLDAYSIYKEDKYLNAAKRLGDFLKQAQMPDPQPAWAQQYNYDMQPIWARKFEPAAISGSESQDVLETLIHLAEVTGDMSYLEPIPKAMDYLKKSQLPDGQLARYYELKTNRPLYMYRRGKVYSLTYDDGDLPKHYGWKISSRLDTIQKDYARVKAKAAKPMPSLNDLEKEVRVIIDSLDSQGRWMSQYTGERMVGQPKFQLNAPYISSAVFSQNITTLSHYLSKLN